MAGPHEPRTIELIEDSPFSPQDKYKLLLTHLGSRRACTVAITSGIWRQTEDPQEVDGNLIKSAEQVLARINPVYEKSKPMVEPALPTTTPPQRERFQAVMRFLVARDLDVLEALKKAIRANDFDKLGQLYGHPHTSTRAMKTYRETIPLAKLAPVDVMTDPARFLDFPLSRHHWQKELEKVQGWVDIVKKHSPVIYEQVRMANWCRLNDEQVEGMFGRLDSRNTSKARHVA